MRVISLNRNGIRSAASKGGSPWLALTNDDIVRLQELKAQAARFSFMERFMPHLEGLNGSEKDIILCPDWNMAHKEIDMKHRISTRKNSGFLPQERAWLPQVFERLGIVDAHWAQNVGWRIDYPIAKTGIAAMVRSTSVYKEQRFSDHAPLIVDDHHD